MIPLSILDQGAEALIESRSSAPTLKFARPFCPALDKRGMLM